MPQAGAIYCAFERRILEMAAISAESFKTHNPKMGCALFAAEVDYAKEHYGHIFDYIEPFVDTPAAQALLDFLLEKKNLSSTKMLIMDRSPFDRTLSIDADTLILADLTAAFDSLDEFDLLVCEEAWHFYSYTNPTDEVPRLTGLVDTRRARLSQRRCYIFQYYAADE